MISEIIDGMSLKLVTRYLRATGWTRERAGESYSLFVSPNDANTQLELFVANSEDVRGWQSSIRDALETLAGLHEKPLDQITLAIRSLLYDVVHSKLPNEMVRDDSIDLDVAAEFIWRAKRLLAASATAEILRSQSFKKVRKEAQAYAGSCRFGHTFRGSFGFTLESPLSEPLQQTIMGTPEAPFERKVVERLARGLVSMDEALTDQNPEILAASYADGWNANVCDEFVKLYEAAKQSAITFSFVWSREIVPDVQVQSGRVFSVSRPKIEILQDAAARLRAREQEQQERIVGRVIELKAENLGQLIAPEGEIVVRWVSEDAGNIKVHMTLPRENYRLAIQAHDQGQTIEACGTLEKKGRLWHLTNIERFTVVA